MDEFCRHGHPGNASLSLVSPEKEVSTIVINNGGWSTNQEALTIRTAQGGLGRRRYLQCPAAVKVRHLSKLLALKLGISGPSGLTVRLFCGGAALAPHHTLIDIAYIHNWDRVSFFKIFGCLK